MKLKPTISLLAAAGMLLFVSACQSGGHEEVGAPVVPREDSLRIFLENLLAPRLPGEETTFFDADVDLDEDGNPETLVYLMGRAFCGSGGCTLLVLASDDASFRVVSRMTLVRPPVRVLDSKSHGWRDFSVRVRGGGIQLDHEAMLQFDGTTYPSNPTMPPARRSDLSVAGLVMIPETSFTLSKPVYLP